MKRKLNYIYKNEDGEYFKCIKNKGQLVLSNPSYPFLFLFETAGKKLEEVGSAKKFGNLVEKKDYEFHDGNELTVEVENGGLKVSK